MKNYLTFPFIFLLSICPGCASNGDNTQTQPAERASAQTLTFPAREIVEALAFAPNLGHHLGGMYAFLDAPGRRVQIYYSARGEDYENAGLFDRAGQVYGAVMWNPADGFALQGGADGTVLYKTAKGWREHAIVSNIEGKYVKLIPETPPDEKGARGFLYLIGSDKSGRGSILKTRDGSSFEETVQFKDKPMKHIADFAVIGERRFIVGGTEGKGALYRSDGGAPFERVDLGSIPNLLSIAFDTSGNGLAVGDNGECLRSSDGGATWKATLSGTEKPLASVVFVANKTAFACGRDGIVLFTKDGGARFEPITSGRREDFFKLQFYGGGVYALGARGAAPFFAPK